MKYLILLLLSFNAFANSLTFDPTIEGQTTLTITCEYPIEREDGIALAISEIAKVNFFVEKDGVVTCLLARIRRPANRCTICRKCRTVYMCTLLPQSIQRDANRNTQQLT